MPRSVTLFTGPSADFSLPEPSPSKKKWALITKHGLVGQAVCNLIFPIPTP